MFGIVLELQKLRDMELQIALLGLHLLRAPQEGGVKSDFRANGVLGTSSVLSFLTTFAPPGLAGCDQSSRNRHEQSS